MHYGFIIFNSNTDKRLCIRHWLYTDCFCNSKCVILFFLQWPESWWKRQIKICPEGHVPCPYDVTISLHWPPPQYREWYVHFSLVNSSWESPTAFTLSLFSNIFRTSNTSGEQMEHNFPLSSSLLSPDDGLLLTMIFALFSKMFSEGASTPSFTAGDFEYHYLVESANNSGSANNMLTSPYFSKTRAQRGIENIFRVIYFQLVVILLLLLYTFVCRLLSFII